MNSRTTLAVAGTAVLAAAISITSIALANGAGPTELRVLGVGAPAQQTGVGGDAMEAGPKRSASDMRVAGPVEYRVRGTLPALGGQLDAWRFDDRDVDPDRVAALADLLGIDGRVAKNEWGDWVVNDAAQMLTVSAQPGNPWYLSPAPVEMAPDQGVASDQPVMACVTDPCPEPTRPEGLPTMAEAERIGTAMLGKVGLRLAETSGVRVDDGFSTWFVSATPLVGGLPVMGMDWSVGVGVDGKVDFANGWLDQPVRGDSYPLIGTTAAVMNLKDQYGIMAFDTQQGAPALRCMDCPDGIGEPFVHTITGVRLAYQVLFADLVPTYLFQTEDGGELFAYAVDEKYLNFPTDVEPMPMPMPMEEAGEETVVDPAPAGKG